MKEQFINFLREKGVEPDQKDIDALCNIAMGHMDHEKLIDIRSRLDSEPLDKQEPSRINDLLRSLWAICDRPY